MINVWFQQGTVWDLQSLAAEGFRQVVKHASEDIYVTSGREGDHRADSLHFYGLAWDMRKCGYTKARILSILPGGDAKWDVVEYSWGFHTEYDPK